MPLQRLEPCAVKVASTVLRGLGASNRVRLPNWETAVVCEDTRKHYAEPRFEATGLIGIRLHVMVFCLRADVIRVISLRKANPREVKSYVAKN